MRERVMFEKYTVIKAVISTKVLLRQLHKVRKRPCQFQRNVFTVSKEETLVFKIELINFRKIFFESLILAQDERWRRA